MSADWRRRPEGGGRFALRLVRAIASHGGRPLARLLLYPITAYFLFRRGPERRASIAFLGRALGRPAGLFDGARHVHTFAATILDRVFLLQGKESRFRIEARGLDVLEARLAEGRGVLLFGSHLGSFEAMRVLSRRRPGLKLRVVLDKAHSRVLTQILDALAPEIAAGVIDAGQDGPALMLQIQQAAAEGALVALLVDRSVPGQPVLQVPFLGAPAPFPMAPWLMAAVLRLPVVLGFGLYHGGNRYSLEFEDFCDPIEVPRSERAAAIESLIRRYAARLEHHARQAPYNWFNFYDFWHVDEPQTRSGPSGALLAAGPAAGGDRTAGMGAGRPG
ncbi:acyltransferase [Luteimonas wenzhouensis]|uniref:Acyltransferase n=1 Tax=Luteimonas wenzhouensis TaxID=2599615 RepID=A0A5C5TV37_9GAMM|nr:acyltransferase [Luteimonas wenzhouensis]NLW97463.1 acyltransferase [Xanthomonadaceae bacterium]TWT17070.1 acyltransferase [Luteimonas wenzhouensis]